jgi:hypothetical protein
MSLDETPIWRVLLFLLAAVALALGCAVVWAFFAHSFTILVFGLPRLTARRRKALLPIQRAFETLVARAFGTCPAASLPKK